MTFETSIDLLEPSADRVLGRPAQSTIDDFLPFQDALIDSVWKQQTVIASLQHRLAGLETLVESLPLGVKRSDAQAEHEATRRMIVDCRAAMAPDITRSLAFLRFQLLPIVGADSIN